MKKYKFKTSINSKNDLEIIIEKFKRIEEIIEWHFNENSKILTVITNKFTKEEVSKKIYEAGFKNEPLMSLGEKILNRLTHKDCCNRLNR